jgi:hypothetical protein
VPGAWYGFVPVHVPCGAPRLLRFVIHGRVGTHGVRPHAHGRVCGCTPLRAKCLGKSSPYKLISLDVRNCSPQPLRLGLCDEEGRDAFAEVQLCVQRDVPVNEFPQPFRPRVNFKCVQSCVRMLIRCRACRTRTYHRQSHARSPRLEPDRARVDAPLKVDPALIDVEMPRTARRRCACVDASGAKSPQHASK